MVAWPEETVVVLYLPASGPKDAFARLRSSRCKGDRFGSASSPLCALPNPWGPPPSPQRQHVSLSVRHETNRHIEGLTNGTCDEANEANEYDEAAGLHRTPTCTLDPITQYV